MSHWPVLANVLAGLFVALPILAPVLMTLGFHPAAEAIYAAYSLVCHQWAHRSFFLFGAESTYSLTSLGIYSEGTDPYGLLGTAALGYKIAFCERDLAIYSAIFLAGLGYAWARARIRPLSVPLFALLILPMAVDGFTQLFGWRESGPILRVVTGGAFGLACVWFIYPRVDIIIARHRAAQTSRLGDLMGWHAV